MTGWRAMMKRIFFITLFVAGLGLYPGWGDAAMMLRVTDVKTRSFSLVWFAERSAACSAKVYADPAGQLPVTGLTIASDSLNHPPAEQNGVMKVDVTGLEPGKTYYFQTETISDAGTVIEPAGGPLPSVRTETTSRPVNNDVLAHKVLLSDGTTPAAGALLLVEVEGGDYPVTGWVDAGVAAPWALVDLNNLYSETAHSNLELIGGEAVLVESFGGLTGFRRLSAILPEEIGVIQTLDPVPEDDQCVLDDSGPIVESAQLLPFPDDVVTENSPLIRASYADQYSEIALDSVRLYLDGADVTSDAAVNSREAAYLPSSPLSDGSHYAAVSLLDEWGHATGPVTWFFTVETASPTASVSYSTTTPTSGTVVVTLKPSEPITVTNNGGQDSYTFAQNGTFTFEFLDQAGKPGTATATVRWIVKPPRGLRIEQK
jgi:hypothetical protein